MPSEVATTELEREASELVDQAKALTVTYESSYDNAGEIAKRLNSQEKKITEHHAPGIKSAYLHHQTLIQARDSVTTHLIEAKSILTAKMRGFEREQKRLADELARQAEEEARRLAAEELEKLIEEMEKGEVSPQEVVAAIAEHKAMPVFTPPPPRTFTPVAGIITRTSWVAEVSNSLQFFTEAVKNPMIRGMLTDPSITKVLNTKLSAMARTANGRLEIPGVRVREVDSSAIRR